jgi:hypothetical protein
MGGPRKIKMGSKEMLGIQMTHTLFTDAVGERGMGRRHRKVYGTW